MTTVISGDTGVSQVQAGSINQDDLAANVVGKGPAFIVGQASGTSIPTTVFTKVVFNSELFDTNNAFNSITSEFVVPVAGHYQFSWASGVNASAGTLFTQLMKNGVRYILGSTVQINTLGAVSSGSGLAYCAAGDVFTIQLLQNSGGTVSTTVEASFFSGFLARAA